MSHFSKFSSLFFLNAIPYFMFRNFCFTSCCTAKLLTVIADGIVILVIFTNLNYMALWKGVLFYGVIP